MPAPTISLNAVTATSASITVANLAADGTLEAQVSYDRDFQFCVCPIYTGFARATPLGLIGLNQDARYYARVRSRRASGAAEDWSNVLAFKTPVAAGRNLAVPAILIDPAIIMKPEAITGWTGSNTVAGYPEKNVSRDAPVAWRSISAAGTFNLFLEHSGAPIDTIAILNTNLPEATTVTVRGAATVAGIGAGAVLANAVAFRASANMPGRPGYHALIRLAAPVEYPVIGIYIATAAHGTPADMVHIEHVLIGLNRQSKNISLDTSESPINLGSLERTRTGNPDRVRGLKMRRVEFDISFLTETQSETLYWDVMTWLDEPVLVVPNSKAGPYLHDRILYGDLKGHRKVKPSSLHDTRTFIVESLI